VEAADDRVDLRHARNLLRLPYRIDDADVATGAEHDETLVLHVKAGRVFMYVFVWHYLAQQLSRRAVARVTAETIFHLSFNE
jgi:hypothetical protein